MDIRLESICYLGERALYTSIDVPDAIIFRPRRVQMECVVSYGNHYTDHCVPIVDVVVDQRFPPQALAQSGVGINVSVGGKQQYFSQPAVTCCYKLYLYR